MNKNLRKIIYKDELYYFKYEDTQSSHFLEIFVKNTKWYSKLFKPFNMVASDDCRNHKLFSYKTERYENDEEFKIRIDKFFHKDNVIRLLTERHAKIDRLKEIECMKEGGVIVAESSPEITDLYS